MKRVTFLAQQLYLKQGRNVESNRLWVLLDVYTPVIQSNTYLMGLGRTEIVEVAFALYTESCDYYLYQMAVSHTIRLLVQVMASNWHAYSLSRLPARVVIYTL